MAAESLRVRAWSSYLILTLVALFFVFPILFMVVGAFKPNELVLLEGKTIRAFWPTQATLNNFVAAFTRARFGRLFMNSVIISTFTVGFGLIANSMFGYGLARLPFRGSGVVVLGVIALTIIPLESVAIPLLWMMSEMGLRNTYTVQILPFIANPLFIYLFYTFFLPIPRDLEDAARVDGAGPVRTFIQVALPLSKPAYATVAILSYIFIWGQLLWPVLVTAGPEVRPLPLGISVLIHQPPINWGDVMAFAFMMTLPLLVLFIAFQRWFVQSVARTGVKG
ncbi:MAG: carbohydrate ABC transporter permease [Spirochaetota bacterium]